LQKEKKAGDASNYNAASGNREGCRPVGGGVGGVGGGFVGGGALLPEEGKEIPGRL